MTGKYLEMIRGKLGEIAVYKYIKTYIPSACITGNLDFSVSGRGQWDITDLIINNKYVNVKSVQQYSSFLLIETLRYNPDGTFTYYNNNGMPVRVDAYILVRVTVDPDVQRNIFRQNFQQFLSDGFKNNQSIRRTIYAEILGGITHHNFWHLKHHASAGIECTKNNLDAICYGYNINPLPQNVINQLPRNRVLQTDNYVISSNELTSLELLFQATFVYICISKTELNISTNFIYFCDQYWNTIQSQSISYTFTDEISLLSYYSRILKLPTNKIYISPISYINISLDNNKPEYMDGVMRIGSIETFDFYDNSLGYNNKLVDNTEFFEPNPLYDMRSYVAQNLSFPIDIIRIEEY